MVLSFRLGKVPVRIAPSFFLMTALLGFGSINDLQVLATWMLVVLASVLVHELGHASMGLVFGLSPRIDLHGMGGTTSWASQQPLSTARRIAISLAGPFAGFAAGAAVLLAKATLGTSVFPATRMGELVYGALLEVNFGWGLLNLLPMLPLDGGHVMAQLVTAVRGPGRGDRPALIVSIVVAALAGLVAVAARSWWPALLAASFLASNWRGLKDLSAREHDAPMQRALAQAYTALEAKDGARVLALARPVALESHTPAVRAEALQLVAFGFLLGGRLADADAAIAALPQGYSPHPSLLELRAGVARA